MILFNSTMTNNVKKIIGRKDKVSFPAFNLSDVPVKIDSGAYSSSMHCYSIDLDEINGEQVLKVVFLDPTIQGYTGETLIFKSFQRKVVKSSNGLAQERFFIKGSIQLFNESFETVFSLTERTGLRNPVLLGRRLLNKRFLIDSSLVNLSFKFEQQA